MEWIVLILIILFFFLKNQVNVSGIVSGTVGNPSNPIGSGSVGVSLGNPVGGPVTGPTFSTTPTGTFYTPPPPPLIPIAPPIAYNPLTPEQAFAMAKDTETNLNPKDFNSPTYTSGARGGILDYTLYIEPSQCQGGAPALPMSKIAPLLAVAISAKIDPEPISKAVLLLADKILGTIFANHAKAVARDNAAFCTYVPGSNNALAIAITGVQNQQLSVQQGIAILQQLPDAFLQGVGPAKNNSPYCNALCEQLVQLRAICFYWRSQFGDASLQNNSPTPILSGVSNSPASSLKVANPAPVLAQSSGTTLAQRRINECGMRPNRKDYDNARDYNSDVKDWNACNRGVN